MVVEVARRCEPLPAHPAHVGLLPAVDPPVGVEAGRGREALGADITDVRPLPGVGAEVAVEEARAVEALAAKVAGEHPLVAAALVALGDDAVVVVVVRDLLGVVAVAARLLQCQGRAERRGVVFAGGGDPGVDRGHRRDP